MLCTMWYLPPFLATFQFPIFGQNKSSMGYFGPFQAFLGGLDQHCTQVLKNGVEKRSPKKPDFNAFWPQFWTIFILCFVLEPHLALNCISIANEGKTFGT